MGQESQIYVKVDGKLIIANYYSWNYGERMVSRARHGIEYIKDRLEEFGTFGCKNPFYDKWQILKLSRIFDVNFDMHDIAISQDLFKEYKEQFSDRPMKQYFFDYQQNSDGQLFIAVNTKTKEIKYAFVKEGENSPLNAFEYMEWDNCPGWNVIGKDWVNVCKANDKAIKEMATLMTVDEVIHFKNLYEETFNEFLALVDFELIRYGNYYGLHDLQGANLGDVEYDRFADASKVIDRLDTYIKDQIVCDLEEELDIQGEDWGDVLKQAKIKDIKGDYSYEIAVLDMILYHSDEINLDLCKYVED